MIIMNMVGLIFHINQVKRTNDFKVVCLCSTRLSGGGVCGGGVCGGGVCGGGVCGGGVCQLLIQQFSLNSTHQNVWACNH